MTAPKICHISTVDISAGILLKNQMRYFLDRGIETHAMAAPGRYVDEVEAAGIPFHAVPMTRTITPGQDLACLHKMVSVLRRERFDLIHLHTPKAVLLGTIAGVVAGVPHIWRTIHGFYFTRSTSRGVNLFFVNLERAVNRIHEVVFSQNSEDIPTAEELGIRRAHDIILLGNGIDLTRFDPEKIDEDGTALLRDEYGVEDGDIVAGFVGRLVVQKGVRELLEAFEKIADDHPRLKLLLVGSVDHDKPDGVPPERFLPERLLPRVIQTGWQVEVERFYPLMDFFVLPSYREGFPRTPMEASALGIPSVATDIRGCREAVHDGVNGLLVPARDPAGLAAGLATMAGDATLRARLGAGGRTLALERFNEVDKFETIYRQYAKVFGL